jgi:hypothetical protein
MTNTSLAVTTTKSNAALAVVPMAAKPHAAVAHALKATTLQSSWAARSLKNASATAQLFAMGMDAETWHELMQMQQSAWQRLLTLQTKWAGDWKGWIEYSQQIKGANTMSKLAEREGNIGAQLAQLLSNQATDLVGLQENIHVDYSYWIHQKLNAKRQSLAGTEAPN